MESKDYDNSSQRNLRKPINKFWVILNGEHKDLISQCFILMSFVTAYLSEIWFLALGVEN